MAQIDVKPLVLKDMRFKVAADNYEKHVSKVQFVPSSSTKTWKGGTPAATFTDATTPTWVCQVDYVQDWETADSFSRYLFEHIGETVAAELTPTTGDDQPSFTANIVITPGAIGGQIDEFGTTSVTFGSDLPELVEPV